MAFYNNSFPVNYQQYYPQSYQTAPVVNQQANQQQATGGIIWVQGEAGAKSYLVAPNQTVQLWDSENQVIYLKSADGSGMPSIKTIDYIIRDAQEPSGALKANKGKFISVDQFESLQNELEALKKDIDKIKHLRIKEHKRKEVDDYE